MKLKFIIIYLFLFSISVSNLDAQNIFDKNNSLTFARYLFNSHQYKLATTELERLIFFDKTNDSLKAKLIESYRLADMHEKGTDRVKQLFPKFENIPQKPAVEFLKLLLSDKKIAKTKLFLESNKNLDKNSKIKFSVEADLLSADWKNADLSIKKYKNSVKSIKKYSPVVSEALQFKRKRPWLAASFSAIIPGTGKIYTTYWKDGLFSLAGIGISAWQAYDGFSTDGIQSVYGWIFGGVATVLYLSNVYGAAKSARKYNLDNEKKLIHKAEHIMGNY